VKENVNRRYLLSQLKADELRKRLAWRCPLKGHAGHDGISHSSCYDMLHGKKLEERIGFFDIEAEDLKADFGITFCWVIIDSQTDKMYSDVLTLNDIKKYSSKKRDVQPKEDTRIIKSFIETTSKFDRLVGHFSSLFDLPFVRTRAVIDKVQFPSYGALYQTDNWRTLKSKFKLSRNTQQNATLKLLGKTRKDRLSLSIKHGCIRGEKWALDLSLKHCKKDVLDARDLFYAIHFSIKRTKTSI